MLYDLGFSDTGKFQQFTDRYIDPELQLEVCALLWTPGFPTEYLFHVLGLRRWQKAYAFDLAMSWEQECRGLGIENAGTITPADGLKMWMPMLKRGYDSVVPHWVSIAVEHYTRTGEMSRAEIAKMYRMHPGNIFELRKSRFNPITLERQTKSVGRPRRSWQIC